MSVQKYKTSPNTPEGSPRLGLFDGSLKNERKGTIIKLLQVFGLITIFMWTMLPVYFGSYYRQTENTHRLKIIILDLDSAAATLSQSTLTPTLTTGAYNAILGPAIVSSAQNYLTNIAPQTNSTLWSLGYVFPTQEEISQFSLPVRGNDGRYTYTPGVNATEWAMEKVHNQDVWGVVLIHGNATQDALNAISMGGQGYDPMGAVGLFYEEARNFFTSNQYIATQMIELVTSASNTAASTMIRTVLNQASAGVGGGAAYLTGAQRMALTRPFSYSEYNLRPFDQLAGEAATTAGAIYLIIFVFFFTPIWTGVYGSIRTKLTLGTDLFLTVFANIGYYFWISLHYSLLSLAFQVNFTRALGYGGFPMYWLINFVTMMALGFPMQIMFEILGQAFFPFFLIFWVIINVSVAFLDIADMDPFYSYGFAFPVWNNVDAAKHIFFNSKSHLVQNFAVNLAWAGIGALLLLVHVFYRRSKETRMAWEEHKKENHPPKRRFQLVI